MRSETFHIGPMDPVAARDIIHALVQNGESSSERHPFGVLSILGDAAGAKVEIRVPADDATYPLEERVERLNRRLEGSGLQLPLR